MQRGRRTGQRCPRKHPVYFAIVLGDHEETTPGHQGGSACDSQMLQHFLNRKVQAQFTAEPCSVVPQQGPRARRRGGTCTPPSGAALRSSPAWRNAGEVEVNEFAPLSCHLLATCGQLLEAAWAGKGSERGSGLLLLAQKRSQQLQFALR